jgi:hypothetical protein
MKKYIFQYLYVLCASVASFFLRPTYLAAIFLVIAPPAVYSFLLLKKTRQKIFWFSLSATIFFALPVELICRLADAWDVQSVLPRPFGLVPLENMIYAFLQFLWVLSFYEYFVNGEKSGRMSARFRIFCILSACFTVLVFSTFYSGLRVAADYYLVGLASTLIPIMLVSALIPKFICQLIVPTIFFAAVFFTNEMFALQIGNLWWPGDYLFPVSIFGVRFALEDVLIWHILSSPALISGYEFFANQGRKSAAC